MMHSPASLLALLESLGIAHETFEHPAIHTVEQGLHLKAGRPGGHSKNLYLKDKQDKRVLICALGEARVEINAISKAIGTGRLSFVDGAMMAKEIGVTPGSVTLFALANADARTGGRRVDHVILDSGLMAHERVWFHPLINTATTGIFGKDVVRFLEESGYDAHIVDVTSPGALQPLKDWMLSPMFYPTSSDGHR
jgi:Ala-tRNA(Pro) deacylase